MSGPSSSKSSAESDEDQSSDSSAHTYDTDDLEFLPAAFGARSGEHYIVLLSIWLVNVEINMVLVYPTNAVAAAGAVLSSELMEAVESAMLIYNSICRDELETEVNSMPVSGRLIDN